MPKKKLYGAALAAYNRKRGRASTALVRRSSSSPTVIVAGAPARRRRYARAIARGGARGAGTIIGRLTARVPQLAASGAYGFLTKPTSPAQAGQTATLQQTVLKIPIIDAIGRKASHGLMLHAIAAFTPGMISRVASHLGDAALYSWAFDFGRAEGSYEEAARLSYGAADHLDDLADDVAGYEDDDA